MNNSPKINKTLVEERKNVIFKNNFVKNVNIDTIFELIRDIKDPEHSYTLEELSVVRKELIKFFELGNENDIGGPIKCISVEFEPTIPHCSMAAIIGLTIKVVLDKFIKNYYILVSILKDSHVNEKLLNKQLRDKDRIQAASENTALKEIIDECLINLQNI